MQFLEVGGPMTMKPSTAVRRLKASRTLRVTQRRKKGAAARLPPPRAVIVEPSEIGSQEQDQEQGEAT